MKNLGREGLGEVLGHKRRDKGRGAKKVRGGTSNERKKREG